MTHIHRTQFLYVLVKELCHSSSSKNKLDTTLRIVYWKDESAVERGYYMIYGQRPNLKPNRPYVPYRLVCSATENVVHFIKTVISNDASVSVELHQFDALNDDTEDEFNIDWINADENETTELVAFDFLSTSDTEKYPFKDTVANTLRNLIDVEVI